jgi:prolyl-tRNA synthetase
MLPNPKLFQRVDPDIAETPETAIPPTRVEDYPEWYQQVIRAADLAEPSDVRGCMVIKQWGYAIWENIQRVLDWKFKETGHENAYFPLFIPLSFLQKEAEHVEGFAKECAVVTHHRLEAGPDGKLRPVGELEEPLVVRPTSETIIGATFARWAQSYRDLPILINQWANVVRWEMRTRMFLRTTQFLWQEGHAVHATAQEAMAEARRMLDLYAEFAEQYMAMPLIKGEKPTAEPFPGAVQTFSIEAIMQDRKALQAGTSHFLGQNFAKAQNIKFQDANGQEVYAWTTSWGVSTRLIGALIMTHGDDNGLVLPPRLAPVHVVMLPIWRSDTDRTRVLEACQQLCQQLEAQQYDGQPVRVRIDQPHIRGGEKVWECMKKGVPIRVELGPKDLEKGVVCMGRRDQPPRQKLFIPQAEFVAKVPTLLAEIQNTLLQRALAFRESVTVKIDRWEDFQAFFTPKNEEKPEIHGGLALCHFADVPEVQEKLQPLKVTVRCIPVEGEEEPGRCLFTGLPSRRRAVFAKAY